MLGIAYPPERFAMRRRNISLLIAIVAGFVPTLLVGPSLLVAQTVELDLITGGSAGLTEQQQWYEALRGVKSIRLKLRRGGRLDQPKIDNIGNEDRPRYRVTGILDRRGRMLVPGAAFTKKDAKKLETWVERLINEGPDGVTEPRGAFGLTSKQLEEAHAATGGVVEIETKGLPTHEVVGHLQKLIRQVPVEVDRLAEPKLYADQEVLDELKGLSAGTALAAALRPLGLAVSLKYEKQKLRFVIVDPKKYEGEFWPIGWAHKGSAKAAAPTLFNYLTVEIGEGTAVSDIVENIGGRIKIPILFDHNAMARDGLEFDRMTARFPEKRTYYKRILEVTLGQGGLTPYLRLDEANRPFLWVTTIKSVDRPPGS